MTHGDDSGLDPAAARRAVSGRDRADSARQLERDRAAEGRGGSRRSSWRAAFACYLDDREAQTPGWKFNEWEMRGVPLRLEIGPKDIEKAQVVLARRDTREKSFVPMEGLDRARASRCSTRFSRRCSSARSRSATSTRRDRSVTTSSSDDGGPPGLRHRRRGAAPPSARPRSRPRRRRRSATFPSSKYRGACAYAATSRRSPRRGSRKRISGLRIGRTQGRPCGRLRTSGSTCSRKRDLTRRIAACRGVMPSRVTMA